MTCQAVSASVSLPATAVLSPPRPNLILSVCLDSASLVSTLPSLLYTPPAAMPYVDLVSGDDYASIWYDTNAPNGNVGGFDPNKPTIVMLHPLFLDSTWLYPQMDDHRLNSQFNIIVFDTRSTGKSISRPTGKYDLWVTAADLAFCFHVRP